MYRLFAILPTDAIRSVAGLFLVLLFVAAAGTAAVGGANAVEPFPAANDIGASLPPDAASAAAAPTSAASAGAASAGAAAGADAGSNAASPVVGSATDGVADSRPAAVTGDTTALTTGIDGTETATGTATENASATGGTAVTASSLSQEDDATIVQTAAYDRRTDDQGSVEVAIEYELPSSVSELKLTVPSDVEVTEIEGFRHDSGSTYEWKDSYESEPSLSYVLDGDGDRVVDTGDWALVVTPPSSIWYSAAHEQTIVFEHVPDGEGVAGGDLVYLGPHDERERDAGDETIRLVVPEAADLAESPEDVLDTLANASDALSVGAENNEVLFVAAPTGDVSWNAEGRAWATDAWVKDAKRLDEPMNTWIHEYVHLRQDYSDVVADDTEWLLEAQANYHGVLLNYEFGNIDHETFADRLEQGQSYRYDDVVLAEPATWDDRNNLGEYNKGALALAAVDLEIRRATDGTRTVQDVLERLNGVDEDEAITHDDFVEIVREYGGDDAAATADTYATTTEAAEAWDERTHRQYFREGDPEFTYAVQGTSDDRFQVRGDYRETSVGEQPTLAAGETLRVPVEVENVGSAAGAFEVALAIDRETVDDAEGDLEAGAVEEVLLEHEFDQTGTYELAVGDVETTVTVREPATPTVEAVEVSSSWVDPGEPVTVTATVHNDADVPGERRVAFTANGEVLGEERVTLVPDERRTVEWSEEFEAADAYEIGVVDVAETDSLIVREPATLTVADLELSAEWIEPGERVTVTATVRNDDPVPGERAIAVRFDGDAVYEADVALDPDEEHTIEWSDRIADPGEYAVAVGDRERALLVREPATPVVSGLSASTRTAAPGETVTVTATVRNDDPVPGERELDVTVDGRTIHREDIALDPDEEVAVEATVEPTDPGTLTVSAGEQELELEVRDDEASDYDETDEERDDETERDDSNGDSAPPDDRDANSSDDLADGLPGFGVAPAVAALVIAIVVLGRR